MGQWLGQIRYGMFPQGLYNINHMPIPESIGIVMPTDYDDKRFLSQNDTELKWLLWPRRCYVSQRWMWLTRAYRARYVITGPGDPAIWYRWYSTTEYLILKLKHSG
jgi:hypothetical protein